MKIFACSPKKLCELYNSVNLACGLDLSFLNNIWKRQNSWFSIEHFFELGTVVKTQNDEKILDVPQIANLLVHKSYDNALADCSDVAMWDMHR